MALSSSYSLWLLPVFFVFSVAIAWFLYFKIEDKRFNKRIQIILLSIRAIAIFLILFLLLNPLLKKEVKHVIDPKVLYIQDNSESISYDSDSSFIQSIKNFPLELKKAIEKDFIIHTPNNKTSNFSFSEKKTDLETSIRGAIQKNELSNLSAIILASDGIINRGKNPLYANWLNRTPIYTLGQGDTSNISDLKVFQIKHNEFSYLNNKFSIHPIIHSANISEETYIYLYEINGNNRKCLDSIKFKINSGQERELNFLVKARSAGIKHYQCILKKSPLEKNTLNNKKDFFIEILDDRQKIALIYNAPHPDISCLKQVISSKKNLELDLLNLRLIKEKDLAKYDLIIAYQIPPINEPKSRIKLTEIKKPIFWIVGETTNLNTLSKSQNIIEGYNSNSKANEVWPKLNPHFSHFELSNESKYFFNNTPPLSSPFADYKFITSDVLFYQIINGIKTEYPLLLFNSSQNTKYAFLLGEGLWQWRIHAFLQNESFEVFDELIHKLINHLALKTDKRKFKVKGIPPLVDEGEPLVLNAFYYNSNYDIIGNKKIQLELIKDDSLVQNFEFNYSEGNYNIDLDNLEPGRYAYKASLNDNNLEWKDEGSFILKPMQLEYLDTKANHRLLKQISENSGGEFYKWHDRSKLINTINNLESKKISFLSFHTFFFIDLKWLFIIIIFLFSLEWAIRKALGHT